MQTKVSYLLMLATQLQAYSGDHVQLLTDLPCNIT